MLSKASLLWKRKGHESEQGKPPLHCRSCLGDKCVKESDDYYSKPRGTFSHLLSIRDKSTFILTSQNVIFGFRQYILKPDRSSIVYGDDRRDRGSCFFSPRVVSDGDRKAMDGHDIRDPISGRTLTAYLPHEHGVCEVFTAEIWAVDRNFHEYDRRLYCNLQRCRDALKLEKWGNLHTKLEATWGSVVAHLARGWRVYGRFTGDACYMQIGEKEEAKMPLAQFQLEPIPLYVARGAVLVSFGGRSWSLVTGKQVFLKRVKRGVYHLTTEAGMDPGLVSGSKLVGAADVDC